MSNDSKKFTLDEKTKIALEAASGDRGTIINLAEKHDVTVEEIEEWIRETGVTNVTSPDADDQESVSILATEEFASDYEFGATPDKLNYSRLFFWTIFGTAVILLFIVAVFNVYDYTYDGVIQRNAEESMYYEIDQLEASSTEELNSFGVVNLEEGIYRIPIDSAITKIAQESE
ncbi:hypothetical protein [Rhodohalobacter sp. 8-1]|uniref:hypothetical protein n=1 Tax=Rhodohalobacter sp. 8-1 TaxID=3131972 RepID=UPI0030ED3802